MWVTYMIHIFDLCQSTYLQIYTFGALRDKKYALPQWGQIIFKITLVVFNTIKHGPGQIYPCLYVT